LDFSIRKQPKREAAAIASPHFPFNMIVQRVILPPWVQINHIAHLGDYMSKRGSNKDEGTRARSAKTGHYVTKQYAKKHPATTVVEHDDKPRRPKR